MNIVRKHPFVFSVVGLTAAYAVFFGISAGLSSSFPDPGLRTKEFVEGIPSPVSSLFDDNGSLNSQWTVDSPYDGEAFYLQSGDAFLSPEIDEIGAKVALMDGNSLPFRAEGYMGETAKEIGVLASLDGSYAYRFSYSLTRLSRIRFVYIGEPMTASFNLSVALIIPE